MKRAMRVRIGTRGSRLAVAQTEMTAKAIVREFPKAEIEIVKITTKGDKFLNTPLSKIGGKGVFVSEIEGALLNGEIDIAVHSAKDLPAKLSDDLEISGVLPRGNYRDALVTLRGRSFARDDKVLVGTGSIRRRLNFLRLFPNAGFAELRGNVETRLNKLKSGEFDGIILAMAGLERLSLHESEDFEVHPFECHEFIPAACQGIIAAESCKNDAVTPIIRKISDERTFLCYEAEREILRLLGADCTMPSAAFAEIIGGRIYMTATADCRKFVSGDAEITRRFELAKELILRL